MTISKRLAAHRLGASAEQGAPETINPEDETEPMDAGGKPKPKKKEPPMTDENQAAVAAAKTEGVTEGMKAGAARMATVMASEHYVGREAVAGKLLSRESMLSASADDIIATLADMPKAAATTALSEEAQREAAEEAGRAAMADALAASGNSNIDAANDDAPAAPNAGAQAWDAVIAKMNNTAKR